MTITSSMPVSTNPTVGSAAIGTAVLSKSLDTFEQSGQDMIKMMEQSVNPNLGANVDVRI